MKLLLLFLCTAAAQAQINKPLENLRTPETLDTIQIQNRISNADTLMSRVLKAYPVNHNLDNLLLTFELEESETYKPSQLDIKLQRSPNSTTQINNVNDRLETMASSFIKKPLKTYKKTLGTYATRSNKGVFIDVKGAYQVEEFKNYTASNLFVPELQHALGNEIDQETSYKIKTGWIPIDKNTTLEIDTTTTQTITTKDGKKITIDTKIGNRVIYNVTNLLSGNSIENEKNRLNLLDPTWYDFAIEDFIDTDTSVYYIVSFKPDYRKSDYVGIMHINASDFAITLLDYEFAPGKNGGSANFKWLMGIKYNAHYFKQTVSFEKQKSGSYIPVNVKRVSSNYIFAHRSLKLKEKDTKAVHKFDLICEGDIEIVDEITIHNIKPLEQVITAMTVLGASKYTAIKSLD